MSLPVSESPNPSHFLLHISDTHFTPDSLLYGKIDTLANLTGLLDHFIEAQQRPAAIIITGDLTDNGDAEAYRKLRNIIIPAAELLGAEVIWVMGNHDDRQAFRAELLDEPGGTLPIHQSIMIEGLRFLTLDTSVPGQHYGEIGSGQLAWLKQQLADPAPHGTILAMHHPPVPSPLGLMALAELRGQHHLAEAISGSDIRAIIAGHLHYSTHSTFHGIPVSVASATCYTQDLQTPYPGVRAQAGGQSCNLIHVYPDRVLHSTVPLGAFPTVYEVTNDRLEAFLVLSPEQQLAALQ